jgi:hypothetical protein
MCSLDLSTFAQLARTLDICCDIFLSNGDNFIFSKANTECSAAMRSLIRAVEEAFVCIVYHTYPSEQFLICTPGMPRGDKELQAAVTFECDFVDLQVAVSGD